MKKKWLKYIVLIVVAGLLAYNSVYVKKLDAKTVDTGKELNPVEYAASFWKNSFLNYLDSAVDVTTFSKMLKENPGEAIKKYAKTQGIGNASCFLLKGEGVITDIKEDYVVVNIKTESTEIKIKLNTGLYFGNAVRDVTGLINMGNFQNTMDYNSVSSELNKIVQAEVVTPFKTKVAKGNIVQFIGCAELNKEKVSVDDIELLPVKIAINK